MIAFLEGTIHKKHEDSLIIKTGGIGYLVYATQNLLSENEEKDAVELYTHTAVREDDISIFGFSTIEELQMFKLLISVSGVGPKTALEILNNPIPSLRYAISNGETALLVNTPGIGKKTAQRIILDLKEKISTTEKPKDYKIPQEINEDALNALLNLGYRRHQIINTIKNKPSEIKETEDIIRYFLQSA